MLEILPTDFGSLPIIVGHNALKPSTSGTSTTLPTQSSGTASSRGNSEPAIATDNPAEGVDDNDRKRIADAITDAAEDEAPPSLPRSAQTDRQHLDRPAQ